MLDCFADNLNNFALTKWSFILLKHNNSIGIIQLFLSSRKIEIRVKSFLFVRLQGDGFSITVIGRHSNLVSQDAADD